MDTKHPDYQSGAGGIFFIKWSGSDCVAAKFEFERNLLLNDVEYEVIRRPINIGPCSRGFLIPKKDFPLRDEDYLVRIMRATNDIKH